MPEPARPSPQLSVDPPASTEYNPTIPAVGPTSPVAATQPGSTAPTATIERTNTGSGYVASVGPTAPTAPSAGNNSTSPPTAPPVTPVGASAGSSGTTPAVAPLAPPNGSSAGTSGSSPQVPVVGPITQKLPEVPTVALVTPKLPEVPVGPNPTSTAASSGDPFRAAGTPGKIDPPTTPSAYVPPVGTPSSPAAVAPAGGVTIPQIGPNLTATGGQQPAAPTTPAVPVPPAVGPASPAAPTLPMLPGDPAPALPIPAAPGTTPAVTPKLPDPAPKLPEVAPVGPTSPTTPAANPLVPPMTGPTAPVAGSPVGTTPIPNPDVLPPAIGPTGPTTPTATAPATPGKVEDVKPAGDPGVRPVANERPASTTFDVDLYEPRAGDTYESISREFYNDTRYAAALRAFNANRALQGGVQVEVPPMHVLRKRFPQLVNTPVPVTTPASAPAARPAAGEWGPVGGTEPGFRASTTYVVPPGGMTLRAVAKLTLGTDQKWADVWELNRQITDPGAVLPAGTELRLPAGAKVP